MPTFEVKPLGVNQPVSVQLAVPPSWTVDATRRSPTFQVPGVESGALISLAALANVNEPAERMRNAIALQYGEDQSAVRREDLSGGRVWAQRQENAMVHARLFVPYDGGVVMGVAMIPDASAAQLPAIRAVLETMTVGAP